MIAKCPKCKPNEFQDKTYGINMRVFNPMRKSGSRQIIGYRCTVCLYENKEVPKNTQTEKEK